MSNNKLKTVFKGRISFSRKSTIGFIGYSIIAFFLFIFFVDEIIGQNYNLDIIKLTFLSIILVTIFAFSVNNENIIIVFHTEKLQIKHYFIPFSKEFNYADIDTIAFYGNHELAQKNGIKLEIRLQNKKIIKHTFANFNSDDLINITQDLHLRNVKYFLHTNSIL